MGQVIDMHDFVVSRMDWRSRFVMERGSDVWLKTQYAEGPSLATDDGFDIAYGCLEIAGYLASEEVAGCVAMVEIQDENLTIWLYGDMLNSYGLRAPIKEFRSMGDSRGRAYVTTVFKVAPMTFAESISKRLRSA